MFCSACGTKNAVENNFCKQCGHKLDKSPPPRISEADFDRALPEDEQVSALLERSYRLRREGDMPGAVALCEEALLLRPESTSAHSLLGRLYEQLGDRDGAIREYERVLELNPGSIADRVKLDELRERNGWSAPRQPAPQIMMVGQEEARFRRRNALALPIGAVFLLLFGSAVGLMLRPHSNESGPASGMGTQPGKPSSNTEVAARDARASPKTADRSASSTPLGPPAPTTPGAGGAPGASGAAPSGYFYPPGPPIYVYPSSPQQRVVYVPVNANPQSSVAPAPVHAPSRTVHSPAHTADSGDGGGRVVLPDQEDGVSPGGDHRYMIRVHNNGGTGDGSGGSGGSDPPMHILVNPPAGSGGDAGTPSASDAQSLIAVGYDKMLKEDWTHAVQAFRKALPAAGDDVARVYQQIGICYERSGDKSNAITNYQKAISEYQKLVSSGHKAETARDGIRICQSGIKACGSE